MGTDKADLLIGEETFLEHIQKNLAGAGEVLLSVGTETDYPKNSIRTEMSCSGYRLKNKEKRASFMNIQIHGRSSFLFFTAA